MLGLQELSVIILLALVLMASKAVAWTRRTEQPGVTQPPDESKRHSQSEVPLLLFVSSIESEFREARSRVYKMLSEEFDGLTRPWLFEFTPASSEAVEDSYLENVRKCDIFLLVLGSELSEPVAREYTTAVANNKPILVFIKDCQRSAQLAEFIQGIRVKYSRFDTEQDLLTVVRQSLCDELLRSYRRYRLSQSDIATLVLGMWSVDGDLEASPPRFHWPHPGISPRRARRRGNARLMTDLRGLARHPFLMFLSTYTRVNRGPEDRRQYFSELRAFIGMLKSRKWQSVKHPLYFELLGSTIYLLNALSETVTPTALESQTDDPSDRVAFSFRNGLSALCGGWLTETAPLVAFSRSVRLVPANWQMREKYALALFSGGYLPDACLEVQSATVLIQSELDEVPNPVTSPLDYEAVERNISRLEERLASLVELRDLFIFGEAIHPRLSASDSLNRDPLSLGWLHPCCLYW